MSVVVFTAIIGDCDSLKPAPIGADRCVGLVDDRARFPDPRGWELVEVPAPDVDPRRFAWRLRCVPDLTISDYTRSVWIDASFTLTDLPRLLHDTGTAPIAALRHHKRSTCYAEGAELVRVGQARSTDVDAQLSAYRRAGFTPSHLSISCVLVRDHSPAVQQFNLAWLREIETHLGDNTQVSLDYAAWVSGLSIRALRGSRHHNPYSTHDHADHKKRRKPYWMPA